MNGQIDLGDMTIAVHPYKGKNPALLVRFKGETEIYKVATFKDEQTAAWFVDVVREAIFCKRGEWMKRMFTTEGE